MCRHHLCALRNHSNEDDDDDMYSRNKNKYIYTRYANRSIPCQLCAIVKRYTPNKKYSETGTQRARKKEICPTEQNLMLFIMEANMASFGHTTRQNGLLNKYTVIDQHPNTNTHTHSTHHAAEELVYISVLSPIKCHSKGLSNIYT